MLNITDPTCKPSTVTFEHHGVERLPDAVRTSTPWTFAVANLGCAVAIGNVAFGWLPLTFGLSLWATITSLLVGDLVGAILLVPLLLVGTRTATNNATSSGAVFGVRGRLGGSLLGWVLCALQMAITVWAGGAAATAAAQRLWGIPDGPPAQTVAYTLISTLAVAVASWGYQLLIRTALVTAVGAGVLVALAPVAMAPSIQWTWPGTGVFLLGDPLSTWLLSALTVGTGGILLTATVVGDWMRYVRADRFSRARVLGVALGGLWLGYVVTPAVGAITATGFSDPTTPLPVNLALGTPAWYAVLLLPLAVLGSVAFSAPTIYSCGLDLAAVTPRLGRGRATVITGVVALVLVLTGTVVFDAAASFAAALAVLTPVLAAWVAVFGVGWWRARGQIDPEAIQVFNRRQHGGPYWYTGGWSRPAIAAWAAGSGAGLLCVQSPYTGPLAGLGGGIDVSLISSAVVAAVVYLGLAQVAVQRTGARA